MPRILAKTATNPWSLVSFICQDIYKEKHSGEGHCMSEVCRSLPTADHYCIPVSQERKPEFHTLEAPTFL